MKKEKQQAQLKINQTLNPPLYGKESMHESELSKAITKLLVEVETKIKSLIKSKGKNGQEKKKEKTALTQKEKSKIVKEIAEILTKAKEKLKDLTSGETAAWIRPKLQKACKIFTTLVCAAFFWWHSNELYISWMNSKNTVTIDDFPPDQVIVGQPNEDVEFDDEGKVDPYPVSEEEKQQILQQMQSYIAQDAANFGIEGQISKILSLSSFQLDEVLQSGTFTNYLVSLKFMVENTVYDMQFYADKNFNLSTDQMSDLDKLNEVVSYLQDPDMCGLYNISCMSKDYQKIKELLIERGYNVLYVGDSQWAAAKDGSIIYKIPVYNSDGSITVWSSDIETTTSIDISYATPEQAFLAQLQEEEEEALFSPQAAAENDNFIAVNNVLAEFQTEEQSAGLLPPQANQESEQEKE